MATLKDAKLITELSEALKEKDHEIFHLKRHVTNEGCVCTNFNKSKVVDFTQKLKAVIENQKKEISELKQENAQLKEKNELSENEAKIDKKVLEQFVAESGVFRSEIFFGSNKIFGSGKNFGSKKNFGSEKICWLRKFFWVQKNVEVQKKFGSKKC